MALAFGDGMRYPWGEAKRLWNILWILLPVFGWLALAGYSKTIINNIVKGNMKRLPAFGKFWDNVVTGFWVIVKLLPLSLLMIGASLIPVVGDLVVSLFSIFLFPWLLVNFMQKFTVASAFEIEKATRIMVNNFADYVTAYLKTIGYSIIYSFLIIVLIGLPCVMFGKQVFMAEFYARHKK